jgi:hypothetical protein
MYKRTSFTGRVAAIERLEVRTLYTFVPVAGVAPVVDNDGNSYVLGSDGPLMAVRRFTPDGEPDSAWAPDGVYNVSTFLGGPPDGVVREVDIPRAMTIDTARKTLFVAGSTDDQWAVARINIPSGDTGWSWHAHFLTGTADALSLDFSRPAPRLGVAGTSATGEVQLAVLFAYDGPLGPDDPGPSHNGGAFDPSFGGGTGYATAPASASPASAGASGAVAASAVLKLDNLPFFNRGSANDEWLVQRTVTSANPGGATLTRKAVVGFRPDGTLSPRFANNRGVALFTLWGDRPVAPSGTLQPTRSRDAALSLAQSADLL